MGTGIKRDPGLRLQLSQQCFRVALLSCNETELCIRQIRSRQSRGRATPQCCCPEGSCFDRCFRATTTTVPAVLSSARPRHVADPASWTPSPALLIELQRPVMPPSHHQLVLQKLQKSTLLLLIQYHTILQAPPFTPEASLSQTTARNLVSPVAYHRRES